MPDAGKPAVLTFLMTDIEGSTRLWTQHEDVMAAVIVRHNELIAEAVERHRGRLVSSKGEGDSTFSVFASPRSALAACADVQLALGHEAWPHGIALRSRAAIHTGEVQLRDGDYFGSTLNRCARLRAIAHGGQAICSQATADGVADDLPDKVTLRDMGTHGLRDLSQPERVFQICHPDLADDFPALASLGTARSNLPRFRSRFFGRDEELDAVAALLSTYRIVTLTGVGGCGKTRLAVEVGARELGRYDGAFFCDLSPIADPSLVVVAMAKAVGIGGGGSAPSTTTTRDELVRYLSTRRFLVVLDNCEHLVAEAARVVDDIVASCPEVTVLATSREALEIDGERAYTVPSLAVPGTGETDSVAARLFVDRARAINASFSPSDDDAAHIAEICRRLDGIPLAIELAAAQVRALSPQQIEARLSDRFRLLSGGHRYVQRQHTLATMLDWSYDLLSENEQSTLRTLAVFSQPFTLEQAEAVARQAAATTTSSLRSLVSKSLVATTEGRYRLLETVRLYAEQRLLASGEAEAVRTRHCEYFVGWVRSLDSTEAGVWQTVVAAQLAPHFDHLDAALRWADAQGDYAAIAILISRVWLGYSSVFGDVQHWFDRGSRATGLSDDERSRFLVGWASYAQSTGDFARLFAVSTEVLTLPDVDSGISHATAHSHLALCHAVMYYITGAGDTDAARHHIEAALAVAHSPVADVVARFYCAQAQAALGELQAARDTLRVCSAIEREPDLITGLTHVVLAMIAADLDDDDEALAETEAALAFFTNHPLGLATDRFWATPHGAQLFKMGRKREGVKFMEDLVRDLSDIPITTFMLKGILGCVGFMLAMNGHDAESVSFMMQAFESPLGAIDHIIYTRYLGAARDLLSPEEYEHAWEEGRSLTLPDASRALDILRRDLDLAESP